MGLQLLIMAVFGIIAAAIASSKGRTPIGWFFGGFFLGLIGIVIVACLSNLNEERSHRQHTARENRRLREQLQQERMKNEAFRQHASARLDVHDTHLQLDTRGARAALPAPGSQALIDDGSAPGDGSEVPARHSASTPRPSTGSQAPEWFYEDQGAFVGPFSQKKFLELCREGHIRADTLVWTERLDDWKPAGNLTGLRRYLSDERAG